MLLNYKFKDMTSETKKSYQIHCLFDSRSGTLNIEYFHSKLRRLKNFRNRHSPIFNDMMDKLKRIKNFRNRQWKVWNNPFFLLTVRKISILLQPRGSPTNIILFASRCMLFVHIKFLLVVFVIVLLFEHYLNSGPILIQVAFQ